MNLIFAQACPRLKAKGRIIEGFMKRVSAQRMLEINSDASKVNYDAGKKLMLAGSLDVIMVRGRSAVDMRPHVNRSFPGLIDSVLMSLTTFPTAFTGCY